MQMISDITGLENKEYSQNTDILKSKGTWVFDLDNTLYPSTSNLFLEVDKKMTAFVMNLLGTDFDKSRALQKDYYAKYGTTLAGLMKHHEIDPMDFMDSVHDIDYSPINKCDILLDSLSQMRVKKYVFTNGTKSHAKKVLERLEIAHLFDGLFGVEDCNFEPKPNARPYEIFTEKFSINANDAVFVEDMAKNLDVPKRMGFSTVYIETDCMYAADKSNGAFIDYKCKNISKFLASLLH